MFRLFAVITISLFIALTGNAVFARQSGGGAGGRSEGHMSSEGMSNTNGPNSPDRDKGQGRAEDRKGGHTGKHKTHGKHKGKNHPDNNGN